ncbi:MAG: hypothetical protein IJV20_10465 [Prevotella sp.]|nr:hypothetical protein [Prevotella sp.]
MANQNIYQLEGKTPDEVKASFIYYMGDKNATSKQIKDAVNSRYVKIDCIGVVCTICGKLYGVDNVFMITDAGRITKISDELTAHINEGVNEGEIKELKNTRSYVNKYRDFLKYCADQKEKVADTSVEYVFDEDPDKPFISKEQFNDIKDLLLRKKNIILQGEKGGAKNPAFFKILPGLLRIQGGKSFLIVKNVGQSTNFSCYYT